MNAQMMTSPSSSPSSPALSLESVCQRLRRANLYGLLAQAEQILHEPWLAHVLEIEESERQRRSLRRRLDGARLGIFKPLADFDYDWPKELDRPLLDELMTLSFCAVSIIASRNPRRRIHQILSRTTAHRSDRLTMQPDRRSFGHNPHIAAKLARNPAAVNNSGRGKSQSAVISGLEHDDAGLLRRCADRSNRPVRRARDRQYR
jgi:hypothetical protein